MQKTEEEIINEAKETLEYNFQNEVEIKEEYIGTEGENFYTVIFDGSKMAQFHNEEAAKYFISQVEWRIEKLFDGRFQREYWNSQRGAWVDWGEAVPAKDL